MSKGRFVAGLLCALPLLASAQVWNSNAGGYNTGYGTVYGSFGLAQATQNMYQTMQMNMQRATMRQAMVNKWGEAAVAEAERAAREGRAAPDPAIAVPAAPAPRNQGAFEPDPSIDTGSQLAEALGSTAEEKELIGAIYTQTKAAYEQEIAAQGWGSNIASGLTFFTVTALVVYNDIEEPADEAVDTFHALMSQSLDELPDVAEVSNADKQAFDNLMVGFSGMLLAGYTQGKQTADAETLAMYRELAGQLIRLVLKVEPDRLRLENGRIVVG